MLTRDTKQLKLVSPAFLEQSALQEHRNCFAEEQDETFCRSSTVHCDASFTQLT